MWIDLAAQHAGQKPEGNGVSELMQSYERRVMFDRKAISGRFFSTFIGDNCTPIDIILKRDDQRFQAN